DILAGGTGNVPNIARQMRRCAAEQGDGNAAKALGINLKNRGQYNEAIEAFQLGVAAGDETSAGWLADTFLGPDPSNKLDYMGQQKDSERASRYDKIWKMLADYSYLHPSVPEINDIVPLPPAPLPVWDGKLKWIEDYKANIEPPKPDEALIERLAKDRQLNPATGRPLPASPDFEKNAAIVLLCKTGEPCPKSGYWQIARLPREGVSQNAILMFKEGDIMPADVVDIYRARPWPFSDKHEQQEQHVEWRFLTEA
ncbi:TPA: sel1 repeat family protein, partial [Enterobacter hormaechei]|nr:sel1 repeat family protein [Enterobacter hormaechei]